MWLHTSTLAPLSFSSRLRPRCLSAISQLSVVQLSRLPHLHCPALTGQHTPYTPSLVSPSLAGFSIHVRTDVTHVFQLDSLSCRHIAQVCSFRQFPPHICFSLWGEFNPFQVTDAHIGITFLRYTHHKYIYSCSVDTEACTTVTAQGSRRNKESGM